jgi:hypothetical protein
MAHQPDPARLCLNPLVSRIVAGLREAIFLLRCIHYNGTLVAGGYFGVVIGTDVRNVERNRARAFNLMHETLNLLDKNQCAQSAMHLEWAISLLPVREDGEQRLAWPQNND